MRIEIALAALLLNGCDAYHNPKDVEQIKALQANLDAANQRAAKAEAEEVETTRDMQAAQVQAEQEAAFAQERQAKAAEDMAHTAEMNRLTRPVN